MGVMELREKMEDLSNKRERQAVRREDGSRESLYRRRALSRRQQDAPSTEQRADLPEIEGSGGVEANVPALPVDVPISEPSLPDPIPSVPASIPPVAVPTPPVPVEVPSIPVPIPSLPASIPIDPVPLPSIPPSLPPDLPVPIPSVPIPSLPVSLPSVLPLPVPIPAPAPEVPAPEVPAPEVPAPVPGLPPPPTLPVTPPSIPPLPVPAPDMPSLPPPPLPVVPGAPRVIPPVLPPAVPPFPSFALPSVPAVPPFPFGSLTSQIPLPTPPVSPNSPDEAFPQTPATSEASAAGAAGASAGSSTDSSASSPTSTGSGALSSPSGSSASGSLGSGRGSENTGLTSDSVTSSGSFSDTTLTTRTRSLETSITFTGTLSLTAGTQSPGATGSNGIPIGPGSTATGSAADPTSSSDPAANGSDPRTPQVVGGIVGGLAGLAFILIIILFCLRRYRRHLHSRPQPLASEPTAAGAAANTSPAIAATSTRSSYTPLVAAFASSLKKARPSSSRTAATASTTGPSERSFQRVAGRKIDPVLTSGGDGYGGTYGAFEKETGVPSTSGTSDRLPSLGKETGFSAFAAASGSTAPRSRYNPHPPSSTYSASDAPGTISYLRGPSTITTSSVRDSGTSAQSVPLQLDTQAPAVPALRPSPARSPVTTAAGLGPAGVAVPDLAASRTPTPTTAMAARQARFPDGVGRSLISQDGSRGSRFTESIN